MGSVKTHKNITNMYFRTCSWMWRNVKDKLISSMLYYLTMDFKPRLYLFTITNVLEIRFGRFEINQLLFANDAALVVDSEEKLYRLLSEFGRVCERRKLRVNVGKRKL